MRNPARSIDFMIKALESHERFLSRRGDMICFHMFEIGFSRVPHGEWTEEGDSKTSFLGCCNAEGILGCG